MHVRVHQARQQRDLTQIDDGRVRRRLGTGEVDGDDAAVLDEHAGVARPGGEPVKQARTADHKHDATSW